VEITKKSHVLYINQVQQAILSLYRILAQLDNQNSPHAHIIESCWQFRWSKITSGEELQRIWNDL
jgi:hypothetical protein